MSIDERKMEILRANVEKIAKEMLRIPSGWFEEVYISRRGKVSFSSPLTGNTWTRDPERVGKIDAFSLTDMEGWYQCDECEKIHHWDDNEGKCTHENRRDAAFDMLMKMILDDPEAWIQ